MSQPIVTFDEQAIRNDLRELVRQTVEDTLNGLLEEEADDLVGAERYERTAGREAYRAGHYDRKLVTTSGEVTVRMPKLKCLWQDFFRHVGMSDVDTLAASPADHAA